MQSLTAKVVKAGAIVGTLDILSAFIYVFIKTGQFVPFSILKFIASGLFGKDALSGGGLMILIGLILHYIIAFAFTIFFFWLFPRTRVFLNNRIVTGIIYGIFIWIVMNLLVLPFTKVTPRPFNITNAIINISILIVCIGIPLSYMAASFYGRGTTQTAPLN